MQSQMPGIEQRAQSMTNELNSLYITIIAGTVGVLIFLIISLTSLAVSLAAIIIGSLGINNCPIQSSIPVWLIVTGVIGFVSFGLNVIRYLEIICKRWLGGTNDSYSGNPTLSRIIQFFSIILGTFSFVWMVAVSTNKIKYFF